MVAAGTYRAHAVDSTLGKTGTGKEQVAVMFEMADDASSRLTWYGYFTENTFERTIQSLRHLGWKGNDLAAFNGGLPEDCRNEVEVVVEHEEDQEGNLRAKIRWINSGNGLAVKERLDEGQARSFAARMKSRIASLGTPAPAPAPKLAGAAAFSGHAQSVADRFSPKQEPPPLNDDDIPF